MNSDPGKKKTALSKKGKSSNRDLTMLLENISHPSHGPITPYYETEGFILYNDDSLEILERIPENSVDMIFADPPYMLSNVGFTCQNGRMVSGNKGKWD